MTGARKCGSICIRVCAHARTHTHIQDVSGGIFHASGERYLLQVTYNNQNTPISEVERLLRHGEVSYK